MLPVLRATPRQAVDWLLNGWALVRQQPGLWLGLAFVYLLLAMLLEQIPFIGWLILLLVTPVLLMSVLPIARGQLEGQLPDDALTPAPQKFNVRDPNSWKEPVLYLRDLFLRSARHLFRGFASDRHLLPVMVASTLLLGGVIVIKLLAALLKAGSSLHAMWLGSVTPSVWLPDLVATLFVLTLLILLIMTVLYTVPLILFRGEHPLPAFEASFFAARNNLGAFVVFAGGFLLLAVLARVMFFFLSFPLDYLLFLLIGLVALPILTGALYASYRDLFVPPRTR